MKDLMGKGFKVFTDYDLAKKFLDELIPAGEDTDIVSGTAKGADQLGERYAKEKGYRVKKFPADWVRYGKGAGHVRNKEMAEYANYIVVFWDGRSKFF